MSATRLAYAQETNLCAVDVAAGLQVSECGHDIAGQVVE
jgi:hypothetical protein